MLPSTIPSTSAISPLNHLVKLSLPNINILEDNHLKYIFDDHLKNVHLQLKIACNQSSEKCVFLNSKKREFEYLKMKLKLIFSNYSLQRRSEVQILILCIILHYLHNFMVSFWNFSMCIGTAKKN